MARKPNPSKAPATDASGNVPAVRFVDFAIRAWREGPYAIGELLTFEFAASDDLAAVDRALAGGCDVFHYAGHTDVTGGRGTLVHRLRSATLQAFDQAVTMSTDPSVVIDGAMEAIATPAPWSASENLAARLARGGTRLAVFNACNSGLWPFMRPLMRAGIPAAVGVQGLVGNLAALNFAEKFYQSLAVGLSFDEAMTYARLYVMQPGRSYYPCDGAASWRTCRPIPRSCFRVPR